MKEIRKDKKNFFSEWLEQLQQESWQLELLISGLALFGIWESKGVIERFEYYIDVNRVDTYGIYFVVIEVLLWSGWAIFLVNLLIHIIVRGLWIGAIGLRYVSGDVDFETLNYSEVFQRFLKKKIGSFDDYIERLEKLSSVLFSFTFLLFFMFFSFLMVNVFFAAIAQIGSTIFEDDARVGTFITIFGFAYYGVGLLVLVDFFTLGAFKKVKDTTFSKCYLFIYRFYSTISLSFIYRPLLLNFIDNKYTRRLFFIAFPYILFILLGVSAVSIEAHGFLPTFDTRESYQSVVSKNSINWRYYDDLRNEHHLTFNNGDDLAKKSRIRTFSLKEFEVESSHLELFLGYRDSDTKKLEEEGLVPFRKRGLRHRLFSRGNNKIKQIEQLDSLYEIELKVLRDILRDQKDVDVKEFPAFAENITYWKSLGEDDYRNARDELREDYETKREEAVAIQLNKIKNYLLDKYLIHIDGQLITPERSFFVTHPNMHERGVKAYISIDSLATGLHELELRWSSNGDEIATAPFYKK